MGRVAVPIALAALLAACSAFGPRQGRAPGWLAPYASVMTAERFCYRTLAEVDCHARPLPGEAHRRVGFFDAPVAD